MMTSKKNIIIGGSAGSFPVITSIISSLPLNYPHQIFLVLHRLKHIRTGFVEALSINTKMEIIEPFDKELIKTGKIYLAPSNYHMFFEAGSQISLSTEEEVNHSRPSIDLSFYSAAYIYRRNLIGIIVSGANKDGALGLKKIKQMGGTSIIQDINEAQISTMPIEAQKATEIDHVFKTDEIINYLKYL